MKVRVFSTNTCSYCIHAKDFLKEKGIEFEDINVAEDAKAREEMVEKTGQRGVPVINIGDEFIVGFNQERLEELLKK
jgi:glutaredoxin-like YruB-family protein